LAHKQIYNSYDASLKWSSAFSNKRVLLDTTAGWHHQDTANLPIDGSEPGSMQGLAGIPRIKWQRNSGPNYRSLADFGGGAVDPYGDNTIPGGFCDPATIGVNIAAVPCPVQQYYSGGPGFIERASLNRFQLRSVA